MIANLHRLACGADELEGSGRATTIKADLISGPRDFGHTRWRQDWVKVSSELAKDRRAGSASVRDVVNAIGDAGTTRPGWMPTQVQVSKYKLIQLKSICCDKMYAENMTDKGIHPQDQKMYQAKMCKTVLLSLTFHWTTLSYHMPCLDPPTSEWHDGQGRLLSWKAALALRACTR